MLAYLPDKYQESIYGFNYFILDFKSRDPTSCAGYIRYRVVKGTWQVTNNLVAEHKAVLFTVKYFMQNLTASTV